eukprot:1162022-Pelagomonas_calceolata.AAC.1
MGFMHNPCTQAHSMCPFLTNCWVYMFVACTKPLTAHDAGVALAADCTKLMTVLHPLPCQGDARRRPA